MQKRVFILIFSLVFILGACELDDDISLDDDPRDKFTGTWSVTDHEMKLNYEVTITRDPNNSVMVYLSNFAGSGARAHALAVGSSLVIETQTIGSNWIVSGTASYRNSGLMEFPYSLVISGNQEERMARFTR